MHNKDSHLSILFQIKRSYSYASNQLSYSLMSFYGQNVNDFIYMENVIYGCGIEQKNILYVDL